MSQPLYEEIVISGFSGRYPGCHNAEELETALYEGRDMVSENHDRWPWRAMNLPSRLGIVPDLDRFDANFFSMNPKDAGNLDPRLKKILEAIFEAMVDAGQNPTELRGQNIGLFMGISQTVADKKVNFMGRSPAMMVNLVSYAFNLKGPSYALDVACGSGLYVLSQAADSIRAGRCDAAVVCGAQSQLDPTESLEFVRVGVMHLEGKCKTFDRDRKGYVKSDAMVALLLQRKPEARRIYATIAATGTNVDGFKEDGQTHPSKVMQKILFEQSYKRFGIDPCDVGYLEAHGTGTVVGDIEETSGIMDFFCPPHRKTPLLIGSVKTNVGHSETASALVSISKLMISICNDLIPGNLHFKNPDPKIKGIMDGKLKVVDRHTPLPEGLLGVNAFGFGGANGMASFLPFREKKTLTNTMSHRLVQVSGRTEEGVKQFLERITENRSNLEYLTLVDHVFSSPIMNHNYRGYAVLSEKSVQEVSRVSQKERQLWYIFSGMGSQWVGMGRDLMRIEVFRSTMKRCADAVRPFGIDLEKIVCSDDKTMFDDIVNCFTGITAMSVCLCEVLTSMGIQPDGIVGHSLGEAICAYADGLVTAEQATLIGFGRGNAVKNTKLVPGMMAAVGLGTSDILKILPSDIQIGCENSDDNVTITGPATSVKTFLQKLTADGVFNRAVETAGTAFHSRLLQPAAPALIDFLRNVLPERTLRTKRWLPSAVAESEWNTDLGRYNSAEYQRHNFLSQVQFNQCIKKIPKDSIVVEIAPRGLLLTILKRSLDKSCTLVALASKDGDNVENVLRSVGQLFNAGARVDLKKFNEQAPFPVSIKTPRLSHLVKWDHNAKWDVPRYSTTECFGRTFEIDLGDPEFAYLDGHVIDGAVILPAASYVFFAWKTFAEMIGQPQFKIPVVFENVKTPRATYLPKTDSAKLSVNIFRSTGNFEIRNEVEGTLVCTGKVSTSENIDNEFNDYSRVPKSSEYKLKMKTEDIGRHYQLQGYDYNGVFLGVNELDLDGRNGSLLWSDNWIGMIDALVQVIIFANNKGHFLPLKVEKLVIDPERHLKLCASSQNKVPLTSNRYLRSVKCGGLEMVNLLVAHPKRRYVGLEPTLQKYEFVPCNTNVGDQRDIGSLEYSLTVAAQIVLENIIEHLEPKVGVFTEADISDRAVDIIKEAIPKVFLKRSQFKKLDILSEEEIATDFDLLVVPDVTKLTDFLIVKYSKASTFLYSRVTSEFPDNFANLFEMELVHKHVTPNATYVLLKRATKLPEEYSLVYANNNNFNWIEDIKVAIKKHGNAPNARIYLVNEDYNSGIVGFFNSARVEQSAPNLRVILVRNGSSMERFSIRSSFYTSQLRKDLTVNVFDHNEWGTYRLLPLEPLDKKMVDEASLVNIGAGRRLGLHWITLNPHLCAPEEKVEVHYASISQSDDNLIQGRVHSEIINQPLGWEYSGLNSAGKAVMGLVNSGALASAVKAHPELTWSVPGKWALEDAATVPLAYTTAYLALFERGHLTKSDSVLVHNGASDLSMAAIGLALHKGCKVFTLVGSSKDVEYVKRTFPRLQDGNIFTEVNYSDLIMDRTGGRGVDVVFNANSEAQIKRSVLCMSRCGRVIEVTNGIDEMVIPDDLVPKSGVACNVTIDDIFQLEKSTLADISYNIDNYLRSDGVIVPLRRKVFAKEEIEAATKHREQAETTDKCLIQIRERGGFFSRPNNKILAIPCSYMNPDKVYIIVGGLGGFGLELTKWLISRGATKVILNSRREAYSGYQAVCLEQWKEQGVVVLTDISDTTTLDGAESLLNYGLNLGPIGGVFNIPMLLRDELIVDHTPEKFVISVAPKVFSTQNFDFLTRKLCPQLDFFIVFSSVVSSLGNATQTGYGFANSALERLCESRRAEGLHGLAIEWGPVGDVGFVARLKTNVKILEAVAQPILSCLDVFDQFLIQGTTVVSSSTYGNDDDAGSEKKSLVEAVAGLFGIKNVSSVDETQTLLALGMDSLLGFEIKHMLSKEYGIEMNVKDIRATTIEQLRGMSE